MSEQQIFHSEAERLLRTNPSELVTTLHANFGPAIRRERTPQEEAEWLEDKRAEYEADRICGHHWSNI